MGSINKDKARLAEFKSALEDDEEIATYTGITMTYEEFRYLVDKLSESIELRQEINELKEDIVKTIKGVIKDLENECLWDALIKLKALEGEE